MFPTNSDLKSTYPSFSLAKYSAFIFSLMHTNLFFYPFALNCTIFRELQCKRKFKRYNLQVRNLTCYKKLLKVIYAFSHSLLSSLTCSFLNKRSTVVLLKMNIYFCSFCGVNKKTLGKKLQVQLESFSVLHIFIGVLGAK